MRRHLLWCIALACAYQACGGTAVVDSSEPLTPCETACQEMASCLEEPQTCVARCDAIGASCNAEKDAFLSCSIAAHSGDCAFDRACADEVEALVACEGAPIGGACDGTSGECYCSGMERGEYTYSCVGGGCSCFTATGFLGACTAESNCGEAVGSCCAQLVALADRSG